MNRIVECIPNFSEGRDEAKIARLVDAVAATPGVAVLDRHSDIDHNRSVITFAGEPDAVVEAALRVARVAVALINLNDHRGEHPRMGALDVLPFVPIRNVTMSDCVQLARQAGDRIARELDIPVFLYERAAIHPDRADLANVRRGGFETLAVEMASNPDRYPDFGQPRVHPTAGAMAVGARPPLIAYNINLATEDLSIAKKIAHAVRGSSGGLQYVKALGLELKARRQVQVSMNLVNYEATPIFRVFEMVRGEAHRYGVRIAGSEFIGLVPQAAVNACADFYLQAENLTEDTILENRIAALLPETPDGAPDDRAQLLRELQSSAVTINGQALALVRETIQETAQSIDHESLDDFAAGIVEGVAAELAERADLEQTLRPPTQPDPRVATFADVVTTGARTPDGASIAAYAGALAAGLGRVICNLAAERDDASDLSDAREQLEELRANLHRAINEDAESRELLLDAISLPEETEGEHLARRNAIEQANKNAAAIPLRVAQNLIELLELLRDLSEASEPGTFADLASGAQLAMTALRSAAYNTFANLHAISDEDFNQARRMQIIDLVTRGKAITDEIEALFFKAYPR